MLGYIVIYIIVGFIAGLIGDSSEENKNTSYGIMGVGAFISLITAGPFVIAAIIEMGIGWVIAQSIFNKDDIKKEEHKEEQILKHESNKDLSKTLKDIPLSTLTLNINDSITEIEQKKTNEQMTKDINDSMTEIARNNLHKEIMNIMSPLVKTTEIKQNEETTQQKTIQIPYTYGEKQAIKNGYKVIECAGAYNDRYFIKNNKKWILNKKALMKKLNINTDDELRDKNYDVDNYNNRILY